jgi:hypothetical protein
MGLGAEYMGAQVNGVREADTTTEIRRRNMTQPRTMHPTARAALTLIVAVLVMAVLAVGFLVVRANAATGISYHSHSVVFDKGGKGGGKHK